MASSLTPAIQAPAGHVSNLVDPVGVGFRITIANIVCVVLFMIVVVVRLITRVFLNRSFGHDDCKHSFCSSAGQILISYPSTHSLRYCIIPGHHGCLPMDGTSRTRETSLGRATGEIFTFLPSSLAHCSCAILGVYAHHEAISAHAVPPPFSHSELPSPMVVRLRFHHCLQLDVHLRIALLLLANLSCMVRLTPPQRCSRLTRNRDISVSNHKCINRSALYIAYTVMNSISTWWILLMPMPIVWSLALKNDQKYLLTSLFALGSLPCVTSIARLKVLVDWLHKGASNNDITYTLWNIVIWT